MPFKRDLALQNIPLSKQPFKTQPQIEIEDVTWSPQYNPPTTKTNKRRALSLQDVELEGWFLILRIVLETCIIYVMHKFNMSFVFHSIFLDWRLGFEPVLQLKSWNLRALHNETHMRASIWNTTWTEKLRYPAYMWQLYEPKKNAGRNKETRRIATPPPSIFNQNTLFEVKIVLGPKTVNGVSMFTW
jgi:hypothetical protein